MSEHTSTVTRPGPTGGQPAAPGRTGVVVVGSVNADLLTTVDQHPRPGETVLGRTLAVLPGGKGANQAVAAAQLGATTTLVGAVGTDQFADPALAGLRAAGVDLAALAVVEGPTGVAQVTVAADGENAIVVIPGANAHVDGDAVDARADVIGSAAVVIVQGEIPRAGIEAAAAHTRGRLVVNLAPVIDVDRSVLTAADPLVVNEHEAALVLAALDRTAALGKTAGTAASAAVAALAALAGTARSAGSTGETGAADGPSAGPAVPAPPGGPGAGVAASDAPQGAETATGETGSEARPEAGPEAEARVVAALLAHGVRSVVLTVGARGAIVADASGATRVPSPRVDAVDTTGAGDAFVGALAYRLSEGDGLVQAARLAARVGAAAVRGSGAQPSYPWAGDHLPEVDDAARDAADDDRGPATADDSDPAHAADVRSDRGSAS